MRDVRWACRTRPVVQKIRITLRVGLVYMVNNTENIHLVHIDFISLHKCHYLTRTTLIECKIFEILNLFCTLRKA